MNKISDYLEFSPYDNKISGDFLRNIPEARSESGKSIDKEKEFWDKFFVEYTPDQYKNTIAFLKNAIENPNKHYILFIGLSGSGKTTFLNYLIRKKDVILGENLSIDMANLIQGATSADTNINIIHTMLNDKIEKYLDADVAKEISRYIVNHDKETPYWNTILFNENGSNDHISFFNFIGSCRERFSKGKVRVFCGKTTNIGDKLALYVISYIFHECIKDKKPCVLIFDNLDELDQTYLVETLIYDFLTAFSKAQDFFEKYVQTENYDFVSKCTFVESIRSNYVATVNACQFLDRAEARSETIRFDSGYQSNLYEIFEKRIRMFQTYQSSLPEGTSTWGAKNFNISIISKERKYIERLSQLFNLDYRMTLSSLEDALEEEIVSWGSIAAKDNDCRLGIRGFLLFYVLKHRLRKSTSRFARYVYDEIKLDGCNKNRMYFSLLTNMCEDEVDSWKTQNKHNEIFHVSLLEFTNRVRLWYKDVPIKPMYETLFVSGNHNYSLPASLTGDTINNYLQEKKYNVSLQALCNYVAELYAQDKEALGNVDIVVNPVCLVYTKHVFIHYEYFNLISIAKENLSELLYGAKSLFQQETKEQIKSFMDRVFDMTKGVINKADNHVCKICHKGCAPSKGKKDGCGEVIESLQNNGFLIQNNMLYASRVITSHINYLDSFRKFLWIKHHENNKVENAELQKCVVEVIERYVDLYRKKQVENRAADVVLKSIEENILFAKNKGYDVWTPIKIGLGSNEE